MPPPPNHRDYHHADHNLLEVGLVRQMPRSRNNEHDNHEHSANHVYDSEGFDNYHNTRSSGPSVACDDSEGGHAWGYEEPEQLIEILGLSGGGEDDHRDLPSESTYLPLDRGACTTFNMSWLTS